MLRKTHPLGLQARHSYDELVRYIETDPTKLKFPDRAASYRRNHPFLTQEDGSKALGEQKRVIDYRLGDDVAPYQPERARFEAPGSRGSDYDPSEDLFDMFARSQPPLWLQVAHLTLTKTLSRRKGSHHLPRPRCYHSSLRGRVKT